jgi:hypothetical protein
MSTSPRCRGCELCTDNLSACCNGSVVVFSGMIAASFLGIFLIPLLYVVFQRLRERIKRRPPTGDSQAGAATNADLKFNTDGKTTAVGASLTPIL